MHSEVYEMNPKVAIAPVVATDNTALVSNIIDVQGYDALSFIIQTGTLADVDATFAVTVEHGNDSGLSDTAAVPADQLAGTLANAGFTFAADGATRKLGYIGYKRYVRFDHHANRQQRQRAARRGRRARRCPGAAHAGRSDLISPSAGRG